MAKKCFDDYAKNIGRAITKEEQASLEIEHKNIRNQAANDGVDIENTVGDKNFSDNVLDEQAKLETLELLDDFIGQGDSLQKTQHFKRDLKANVERLVNEGEDINTATTKALVSMIFDTNDTRGTTPFLELFKSMQVNILADFNALTKTHAGKNFDQYINDKKNYENFYRELIEIEMNTNKVDSVTGDQTAFSIAKGFVEFKQGIVAKRILTGDKSSFANTKTRIIWDRDEVKKKGKETFVKQHLDDLDEGVHGNADDKRAVLEKLFDHITQKDANWRTAGDTAQKGRSSKFLRKKAPVVQWRDGETFLRLHKSYSRVGLQQQLMSDVSELARDTSIKQFFGNNPRNIINFIEKTKRTIGKDSAVDGALDKIDQMLNPHHYEYNNTYAFFRVGKNLEVASKLGTAPITATLDIPTAIIAGKGIFNLDFAQTIKLLVPGGLSDERAWAREMAFIFDDMIGRYSDEFSTGATFTGKINKATDYVAQKSMKISFLQQWTNTMRGGVVGLMSRHLGKYITKQTQFKDLPKSLQNVLAKYGIDDVARGGQPAWTRLLQTPDAINERGFINLRVLDEKVFETAYGNNSLRTNLTTMFNDVSKTLIIEGNDYDKALATFFTDDRKMVGAAIGALQQFKAIPVGIFRKLLVRYGKQNDKVSTMAFGTAILSSMTAMGFFVNAAKDYVAGKEPVTDFGEAFARAVTTGGGIGIASDLFMQMGGEELIDGLFSDKKYRDVDASDLVFGLMGPLFSDAFKITGGVFDLTGTLFDKESDMDDLRGEFRQMTQQALGLVPLQNLWWARMVIRKYLHENLQEWADPKGWNAKQRRLRNRARDQRNNDTYNNILYESLPNF